MRAAPKEAWLLPLDFLNDLGEEHNSPWLLQLFIKQE